MIKGFIDYIEYQIIITVLYKRLKYFINRITYTVKCYNQLKYL